MAIKIEYRIGIAAPVDEVYEVLSEVENWPQWSPIHKAASGQLKFGAPVRLEEYYEGLGTWELEGSVADYQPLSHIHINIPKPFYAGRLIRYFELDILSQEATSFSVGALFDGFLSEREGRQYRQYLRGGFQAFSEALKVTSEEVAARHHNQPRSRIVVPEPPPLPKKEPAWKRQTHFWGRKKK